MKGLISSAIIGGLLYVVPPIPQFNYITPSILKKAEIEAKINGIDPVFYKALLKTESAFKPEAVSHAGAKGVAQLMPRTIEKMGVRNAHDPHQSIEGGARWLNLGMREYAKGDYKKLAKWYNCGLPILKKNPSCGDVYWNTVKNNMKEFKS